MTTPPYENLGIKSCNSREKVQNDSVFSVTNLVAADNKISFNYATVEVVYIEMLDPKTKNTIL